MRRGHRVDASLQRELVQQPAAAACQKGRGRLPVAHLRAQMPGVRINRVSLFCTMRVTLTQNCFLCRKHLDDVGDARTLYRG